jgi:hypothetical protein
MKKLFAIIASCALLSGGAWADGMNFGVAGVYGLDLEGPGIQLSYYQDGFYNPITQSAAKLGGDFTYFLPDEPPGASITAFTVNVNLLTSFYNPESGDTDVYDKETESELGMDIYAITGLNLTRTSVEVKAFGFKASADSNDFNINIGAGLTMPMGFGDLFGEAKYVLGGASQLVVGVGVRFSR